MGQVMDGCIAPGVVQDNTDGPTQVAIDHLPESQPLVT